MCIRVRDARKIRIRDAECKLCKSFPQPIIVLPFFFFFQIREANERVKIVN